MTGPGVGPMIASGIGTGYTSGYSNVGVGDDYYGRGGFYGMGAPGIGGGFVGAPGYSSGFVGAPGMGMVGNAGLYNGGLGMGQFGTPGLTGGLGYMTGGAGMGGIGGWVRRGFYFFPFPGFCPPPSVPVFKINKRWWYCRIWFYKKSLG